MHVIGSEGELLMNKSYPCVCGKGVGANSALCMKCCKWMHGRCTVQKKRLYNHDGRKILSVESVRVELKGQTKKLYYVIR